MSVLFNIFTLSAQNGGWIKYYTYSFTWNITKQTHKRLLKARMASISSTYLIDYILTPSWVSSKLVLQHFFLPHTLNVFTLHVYLYTSVLISDVNREFLAYELRVYTFLLLFNFGRFIRYLGRSNREDNQMSAEIGHKFEIEIFRPSMDD